jgi:hypothetical protein
MPSLIALDKFRNWLLLATPGEQVVYHTGHLASERERTREEHGMLITVAVDPEDAVGWEAWRAYEIGLVELVQRRVDENVCDYIAVKKGKRNGTSQNR